MTGSLSQADLCRTQPNDRDADLADLDKIRAMTANGGLRTLAEVEPTYQ